VNTPTIQANCALLNNTRIEISFLEAPPNGTELAIIETNDCIEYSSIDVAVVSQPECEHVTALPSSSSRGYGVLLGVRRQPSEACFSTGKDDPSQLAEDNMSSDSLTVASVATVCAVIVIAVIAAVGISMYKSKQKQIRQKSLSAANPSSLG
jgi:hypothetical protein